MELLLQKWDLCDIIENQKSTTISDEWKKLNKKVDATIGLLLDVNQVAHIRNSIIDRNAWSSLKNHYTKST